MFISKILGGAGEMNENETKKNGLVCIPKNKESGQRPNSNITIANFEKC